MYRRPSNRTSPERRHEWPYCQPYTMLKSHMACPQTGAGSRGKALQRFTKALGWLNARDQPRAQLSEKNLYGLTEARSVCNFRNMLNAIPRATTTLLARYSLVVLYVIEHRPGGAMPGCRAHFLPLSIRSARSQLAQNSSVYGHCQFPNSASRHRKSCCRFPDWLDCFVSARRLSDAINGPNIKDREAHLIWAVDGSSWLDSRSAPVRMAGARASSDARGRACSSSSEHPPSQRRAGWGLAREPAQIAVRFTDTLGIIA
jgi:hypothetical protein